MDNNLRKIAKTRANDLVSIHGLSLSKKHVDFLIENYELDKDNLKLNISFWREVKLNLTLNKRESMKPLISTPDLFILYGYNDRGIQVCNERHITTSGVVGLCGVEFIDSGKLQKFKTEGDRFFELAPNFHGEWMETTHFEYCEECMSLINR
ncbi:MAG: hypothetical protein ACI9AT_000436 [Ulvibacter sp.]|jgi:hypothetical protein